MAQSVRMDRSLSWTVQQAWRLARAQVSDFPAVDPGMRTQAQLRRPEPGRDRNRDRDQDVADRRPSAQVLQFLRGKFDNELTG